MQSTFLFLHAIRRTSVFFLHALLLCLPFGCAGSRHGADLAYSVHAVDVTAAYNACVAVCSENTSLALVTRTGCLEGCAEARRSFPLAGKSYTSQQDCLDALTRTAGRDHVREMREWCDARWTHIHNRKGCRIAVETFYANLSPASMCGSDGEPLEAYGAPPARSLPETPEPATPVLQEQPVPTAAMPAPEAPAAQPSETPRPDAPGAPVTQAADPDAPVRSTQPAGPLVPPPYVPEPSSQAVPKDTPAPLPAIRDTPKYQKSGTTPSRAPGSSGVESPRPTQPVISQSPATEPKVEPTTPPAPEKIPATTAPSPSGTAPQAPSSPMGPAPSMPVATPVEQPVEPVAPPAPQQPNPDSIKPEVTPRIIEQPAAPAHSPLPDPPPEQPTPSAGVPEPARRPLLEPETTPGGEPTPSQPTQGPPLPGLNANRPLPPSAAPSAPATEEKGVAPPVPSMLNRPYSTPTIITPQIDIPPER